MASNGWNEHFRVRLNDVLRQRQIANTDLASAIGVHPNTITRWRSSPNASAISAGNLCSLSKHLKVPPALWFVESAASGAGEEKLRKILDYVWSLDEKELERFLALIERIIDVVEGKSAKPEVAGMSAEGADRIHPGGAT